MTVSQEIHPAQAATLSGSLHGHLDERAAESPRALAYRFLSDSEETDHLLTLGDLARWHAEGTLECLGRSDSLVKIRGFRVELGEIESALAAHPEIAQAKVAARGNDTASKKLLAWIIPAHGRDIPATLREFLAQRLPPYMLPSAIGIIDVFPLNSNGKVDISQLPDPAAAPVPASGAPLTETERHLAAIWRRLLARETIHRDDNWFHIGGHTLLALRRFSKFHLSLPVSTILERLTLASLAGFIDEKSKR